MCQISNHVVDPLDVAAYIFQNISNNGEGSLTAMKLQKLLYYSQAWSLVWDEAELFEEDFQAWAGGPVLPSIYDRYKGMFYITQVTSDGVNRLSDEQKETIDAVLKGYGNFTGNELSNLTHKESPWLDARQSCGLAPNQRGSVIISKASMAEFYGNGEE